MKRLFHLSTVPRQLGWFDGDWQKIERFVEKNDVDGIELGLTLDYPIEKISKQLIEGVHLTFYPMWLDFWRQDEERLKQVFKDEAAIEAYYGTLNPKDLVTCYTRQYERAKALEAKYMVFHISHILPEHSFNKAFDYTDEEVMEAALELVNAAFLKEEGGPLLLFENLWWPGLTYLNPELTKTFIEKVNYPQKGYLVDVSHLILTNPKIGSENEAARYIKKVIRDLGDTAQWIKGVHMNKALPKHYMSRNHDYLLDRYRAEKDERRKCAVLKQHIKQMDGHIPFDHPAAKDIIDCINPEFCVYETAPESRYELAYYIKKQNKALGYEGY